MRGGISVAMSGIPNRKHVDFLVSKIGAGVEKNTVFWVSVMDQEFGLGSEPYLGI
jgi:hypothetical protein